MLAPSLNPRLWYSPQSAGALARNLASNFYYTVYAHFGLIWPDTLPHDVLSTLTTNDEYPEPTAIPDNEFIRQKIVPAIKFLLPILRELWTEKERQAGTLVDIEPTGDPVEQQGLHLFIARKLRNAQDELKLQNPKATSIQKALHQHPATLPQMIQRLSGILALISSSPSSKTLVDLPRETPPDQAEAGSIDLIDLTSPPEQHREVVPALGSPLLLKAPMNHVPWGDSDEDISADEREVSPQRPLESPYSEDSVGRGHGQSPSTAPTTPAKSPCGATGSGSEKAKTKEPHLILYPPADSGVPVVVLTTPTGSTDSQEKKDKDAPPEEVTPPSSSSPANPERTQSAPGGSSPSLLQPIPALHRGGQGTRLRDPYKTPERPSASLPTMRRPTTGQPNQSGQQTKSPTSGTEQRQPEPSAQTASPRTASVLMSPKARSPISSVDHDPPSRPASPAPKRKKDSPVSPAKELRQTPSLSITIPPTPPRSLVDVDVQTTPQSTPIRPVPSRKFTKRSPSDITNRSNASTRSASLSSKVDWEPRSAPNSATAPRPERRPKNDRTKTQAWKGKNPSWSALQQDSSGSSSARYYGQSQEHTVSGAKCACCCGRTHRCHCKRSTENARTVAHVGESYHRSRTRSLGNGGHVWVGAPELESNNAGFLQSAGLAFEDQEYGRISVVVVDIHKPIR